MDTHILGIMSGSSLDGLDLALCTFHGDSGYRFVATESIPLPIHLIKRLQDPLGLSSKAFLELSSQFSIFTADAVNKFLNKSELKPSLIVSHGHTIYHDPLSTISCQIGSGGIIASRTGINTLSDLRIQDVALGGQGAPLASLVDRILFDDYDFLLNLGGIANISYTRGNRTLSWDVSPCNQVLNQLSSLIGLPYDDKGNIAKKGKLDSKLYRSWQSLEYFKFQPPKSLDNYWVKEVFSDALYDDISVEDGLNTMCNFIADQLVIDLEGILSTEGTKMMITGGGCHNDFLIHCIRKEAAAYDIEIVIPSEEMIDFKEALLMAFMGYRYLHSKTNILSTATGSSKDTISGALYLGNE